MEQRPDWFTAVLDASVLVGALKRNILLCLAEAGFFRPRWSSRIIDEMAAALAGKKTPDAIGRLQSRMEIAFPEGCVSGWEAYKTTVELPDESDRHVLAAAIKCDAAVIVTENIRDFPAETLGVSAIQPMTTDAFVADLIDLDQAMATRIIERMRQDFRNPPYTFGDLLDRMTEIGLTESAAILRALGR